MVSVLDTHKQTNTQDDANAILIITLVSHSKFLTLFHYGKSIDALAEEKCTLLREGGMSFTDRHQLAICHGYILQH